MDGLSQFAPRADQAPATPVIRRHIDHPSAWKVADFHSPADYSIDLASAELADIESCVKAVRALGLKLEDIERKHFPLPTMAGAIAAIRREIADGRGFVVLRQLPVEAYSKDEIGFIYWGIGTHLGVGQSQSVMGDRLGHVKDFSREDPNARAYRNKQELSPHTDLSDLVGLCSLRSARSGGVSRLAFKGKIAGDINWASRIWIAAQQSGQDPNAIADMDKIFDRLRKSKEVVLKYYSSGAEQMSLLANEEVWIADVWAGRVAILQRQGQPLRTIVPPGARTYVGNMYVLKGSPMDAAQELVNFMLEPDAAIAVSKALAYPTVLDPTRFKLPEEITSLAGFLARSRTSSSRMRSTGTKTRSNGRSMGGLRANIRASQRKPWSCP
jgi:extracellular solute-binding protein/TfdA family taurine catabolism dioxygenase TauD